MNRRPLGLAMAFAILTLSVLSASVMFGCFAYNSNGINGFEAVLVAAIVCWIPATIALVLTRRLRGTTQLVTGMLVAQSLFFVVPLAAAVAIQTSNELLAAGGVFGWIVTFYLLTLFIETILSVFMVRTRSYVNDKSVPTNG